MQKCVVANKLPEDDTISFSAEHEFGGTSLGIFEADVKIMYRNYSAGEL